MPDIGPWLPTATAVLAALIAGLFAWRANQATIANQRVIELEKRLSTSRLETYKPLLEAMASYIMPADRRLTDKRREQAFLEAMQNFITWVQVYGSDEAVRTFHRWMQASYASAPPLVALRMYGDFLVAARRDIGDSATTIERGDLLGIRIKDFYEGMVDDMKLSDEDFYRKVGWTPPWSRATR